MQSKLKYLLISIALVLTFLESAVGEDLPCAARAGDSGQGCICVCNSTYCDTVESPTKLDKGLFYFYKTSNSTPGFTKTSGGFINGLPNSIYDVSFTINPSAVYQTIEGFGAAVTDTSGLTINYLPAKAQEKLMESYFGPTGIEYNFLRLPIGSTDFSSRVYTLDDVSNDENLTYFSLADEDYNLKIPMIKTAMNMSQRGINIIACTWLAPSWMKNNNTPGAQFIRSEYYDAFAKYHLRFLEEYKKEGVPIWALAGGNEIMMMLMIPKQNLLNLTLASAIDQRSWLRDYLKPQLVANGFTDVKFITLEDERIFVSYWMERFGSDPEALSYLDGIAVHTYSDRYVSATVYDNMTKLYPTVGIYYTETSINTGWGYDAVILGSWDRAETYLSSMFEVLNHWSRTFMDWNLALDTNGGPSMTYDIDAAVIINQTGAEFYKQPIFYALGHFSKFVPPGAKRVEIITSESESYTNKKIEHKNEPTVESLVEYIASLQSNSSPRYYKQQNLSVTKEVQCIAFVNPDGSYTAIILNTKDEPVKVRLEDSRVGYLTKEIEEHSLNTFVYWPLNN